MSEGTQPPGTGGTPQEASKGPPVAPKADPKADSVVTPPADSKADPKVAPQAGSKAKAEGEGRSGAKTASSPAGQAVDAKPGARPGGKADTRAAASSASGATTGAGASAPPPQPPAPVAAARPAAASKPAGRAALWLALLALVLAIGAPLAVWQWSQKNFQELARRVQDSDARSSSAAQQANQAVDQVRELRSRTEVAEAKLAEAAGQQAQLEKLYRSVALDSADAMLAELESALSLAAQQLASGAGAESALLALQSADGRLARLDDPALAGVRRAIARDTERLRSATSGDIGVLAARLDNLARGVDSWPLKADALARADTGDEKSRGRPASDARVEGASETTAGTGATSGSATGGTPGAQAAQPAQAGAGPAPGEAGASDSGANDVGTTEADSAGAGTTGTDGAEAGTTGTDAAEAGTAGSASFLDRVRAIVKVDRMMEELASLFRVRRVDAPDAALIAPDQVYFLRENLRLRLLNARLALLSRNDPLYRSDIAQAVTWIERYFDRRAPAVERALVQLEQLSRARTAAEAPSVNDSLGAVRAARAARESRQ